MQRLHAVFDPRRTPDRFVPFLAAWLDLGRVLPVTTGLSPLRELVAEAAAIAQTKGTARGLMLFLETAVGVSGFVIHEEVLDPDGRPRPFHVRIVAPAAALPHRALVERIIESEKPAHVTYDLEFAAPDQRGVQHGQWRPAAFATVVHESTSASTVDCGDMHGGLCPDSLRKPLFFVAAAFLTLAFLMELGSPLLDRLSSQIGMAASQVDRTLEGARRLPQLNGLPPADLQAKLSSSAGTPPGRGVPYMALLDGLLLFTVILIGMAFLVPERIHGRIQGVVTLLVSLSVLLTAIVKIFTAIAALTLMVTLLLAIPFGTIIYLIGYGSFDRGLASVMLSAIMTLKFLFAGCLVFAHQGFLKMKGLVLIVVTSLVAGVVVSFLHGLVPTILVSITDAIAAIVVAILAALWALFFLIGSIPVDREVDQAQGLGSTSGALIGERGHSERRWNGPLVARAEETFRGGTVTWRVCLPSRRRRRASVSTHRPGGDLVHGVERERPCPARTRRGSSHRPGSAGLAERRWRRGA